MSSNINYATPPNAIRVFAGYASERFTLTDSDTEEEVANKRTEFFSELGNTFMPGTPLMQAPLGLAAYLPAVIQPEKSWYLPDRLPDEVAIIVYSSQDDYAFFRSNSLSRRMYTRSHFAAFNMGASLALFPGNVDNPTILSRDEMECYAWYLFEDNHDWQKGETRTVILRPQSFDSPFPTKDELIDMQRNQSEKLRSKGIDQLITLHSGFFIVFWIHSTSLSEYNFKDLGISTEGAEVYRDMISQKHAVAGDSEQGITIAGPGAHNFTFNRHSWFFRE